MSSKAFIRKWRVTVGDFSTDQLRVNFRIVRTLGKEPNTCDLKIYNLSEASRARVQPTKFAATDSLELQFAKLESGGKFPCIVEAGYAGQTVGDATIFSGDTRTVDHVRERADWITHVQCGDGEKAYQFANLNKAFSNTDFGKIVEEVATSLTPNLGNLKDMIAKVKSSGKTPELSRGFVAHGKVSATLAELLKSSGLEYSIQNGELLVVEPGQAKAGQAIKLTPTTGLVGSPDHTPPEQKGKPATLKCKSLLNPQITPACTVRVESEGVSGDFVVQKVEHMGDSHSGDWSTSIEAWAKK